MKPRELVRIDDPILRRPPLFGPWADHSGLDISPQALIKGQSLYMEDNFVITSAGTELLTPGLPYTAEEIETVMRTQARSRMLLPLASRSQRRNAPRIRTVLHCVQLVGHSSTTLGGCAVIVGPSLSDRLN